MAALILMIQFMTRYPLPGEVPFTAENFVCGMKWMPLVGLLIGLPAAALFGLAARFFDANLAAFFAVLALILITGGLHLDGLGDTADGLFSNRSPEKMLHIMRDPATGANGVVAIVLALLFPWLILSALPTRWAVPALLAAPVAGRMALTWHAAAAGYARNSPGLGAFVDQVGSREALRATLLALVLLLPICLSTPNALLLLVCTMAVCMALAVGFARFLTRKLGGITGDTIGATIELSEIATFFIFYLFWKLA